MNFFIASALLNAFVAGLLGLIVILKNRKDIINRLFFLITISIIVWALGYWQWMSSMGQSDPAKALFWARILSIGSLFIPVFYFHWILAFVKLNKQKSNLIKIVYIIALIFLLFSFSELFVKEVSHKSIFPFWPTAGPLYSIYLIFIYFGLVAYSLITLWKQQKINTDSNKRSSIKYIILGTIIAFGGGATNFPLWYGVPILPYGNILVSIYPIVFTIAIARYQLFNIRVIATELLTFAIWIFVLVRLLLADNIQERLINGGLLLFLIISGILLVRSVLKVEELGKAKSEFVTIASHQLRASITAIKGYSSMVLEGTYGEVSDLYYLK